MNDLFQLQQIQGDWLQYGLEQQSLEKAILEFHLKSASAS